ncbi:MAG: LysR family transcriptional regulator, partial [Lachnospiraceae bacterium]|nr:LysR family transcriptional regulator [Lachnospiraceae bacterium]
MSNNLSSYKIFCAVANNGNISSAAKELYISQPAVSKAISKLEQNLNVTLFDRTSRGVKLTYEGRLLYTQVEGAFHAIRQGENQIKRIATLGIGHLSLGVSTTLCKYVLLPSLQEFIQSNPHINLSVSCQSTNKTISDIENGNLEIGLIGEPSLSGNFLFQPLKEIQDIFVTTENYLNHLKMRDGECLSDIFGSATLILLDKDNLTRQYVDRFLSSSHIEPKNIIEVTTMDLLIEFAKTGLGIACVIKEFVEHELNDGSLIEYAVPFSIPKRNIGFVYPESISHSSVMERFVSFYLNQQFC